MDKSRLVAGNRSPEIGMGAGRRAGRGEWTGVVARPVAGPAWLARQASTLAHVAASGTRCC